MRNLGGTHHAKVELHEEIKAIEKRLAKSKPYVRLHSFLVSVTPVNELSVFWNKTAEEIRQSGIVFQEDPDHIRQIIHAVLEESQPPPSPEGSC
jgi:hypothetical protein